MKTVLKIVVTSALLGVIGAVFLIGVNAIVSHEQVKDQKIKLSLIEAELKAKKELAKYEHDLRYKPVSLEGNHIILFPTVGQKTVGNGLELTVDGALCFDEIITGKRQCAKFPYYIRKE